MVYSLQLVLHVFETSFGYSFSFFSFFSRIDDCHDVLKELHYAAREKDDGHGRAVYYCYCFDLILETGKRIITLLKEIVIFSK